MAKNVLEIHHPLVRINGDDANLSANLNFYQGLLGLSSDSGRPLLPGIPGFWINVGETGQIHLIGGEQPSRLVKSPDKDPISPHIALAVSDIVEAKAELEGKGMEYWSITGISGLQAEQLFLLDPQGNMIELHQVEQCRCRADNRR